MILAITMFVIGWLGHAYGWPWIKIDTYPPTSVAATIYRTVRR